MGPEGKDLEDPDDLSRRRALIDRLCETSEHYLSLGLPPALVREGLLSLQKDGLELKEEEESGGNRVRQITRHVSPKGFSRIGLVALALILPILLGLIVLGFSRDRQCLLPSHPLLMELVRPVQEDCGFCGKKVVVFKKTPTPQEFEPYAYSSRPIIIRNYGDALRAKGLIPLNFSVLVDIFEGEERGVESVSEECQFLPFRSPFLSLRDAFDRIKQGRTGGEDPWYIGWSNCHPGVSKKIRELVPRPDFLPSDSSLSALDWIFVGSPGWGAAMHIDYVRRPSWQLQLSGVKRWVLRPTPDCEAKCQEEISFLIYPGDLLFLETNSWYHETFVEGDDLSISIGSEYD